MGQVLLSSHPSSPVPSHRSPNPSHSRHLPRTQLLHPDVRPDLIAGRKREQIELKVGGSPSTARLGRLSTRFIRRLRKQPSAEEIQGAAPPAQRLKNRLGPFDLEPLGQSECESFNFKDEDLPSGGSYKFGLVGARMTVVSGRLSKAAPITLDASSKENASIPPSARKFAFVYSDAKVDAATLSKFSDAAKSFLQLGGFVYWDVSGNICGLRALKSGLGMHFSHPRLLEPHPYVRATLYSEHRVFPPTIASLCEAGVEGFAWISPGEVLGGHQDGKMLWSHGAFAYFYADAAKEFDCFCTHGREEQQCCPPPLLLAAAACRCCLPHVRLLVLTA